MKIKTKIKCFWVPPTKMSDRLKRSNFFSVEWTRIVVESNKMSSKQTTVCESIFSFTTNTIRFGDLNEIIVLTGTIGAFHVDFHEMNGRDACWLRSILVYRKSIFHISHALIIQSPFHAKGNIPRWARWQTQSSLYYPFLGLRNDNKLWPFEVGGEKWSFWYVGQ